MIPTWLLSIVIYSLSFSAYGDTFQINDFQIIINDTHCNTDQFCLRIYHPQQMDYPVFSVQQYYLNSRSKVPFIILSQATLSTEPVLNGEPQKDFMNKEVIVFNSTDISTHHIHQNQSTLCVELQGMIQFDAAQRLPDIEYTFSICPPEPSLPYYDSNTRIESQNSLDWSVSFKTHNLSTSLNRIFVTYDSESKESLLGFGVQYSFLNFKGKKLPIFCSEQGIGRGLEPVTGFLNDFGGGAGGSWYTTYSSIPLYISTFNRSVLFYNYELLIFDMQHDAYIQIELYSDDALYMSGRIIYGDTPLNLIQEVTLVTGRMDPLPDWSQSGGILGVEGGTKTVLNYVQRIMAQENENKYDLSMVGVWIQDWSGTITRNMEGTRLLWNWEVNTVQYPGWEDMVKALRDTYHVPHMLTYVNPYFVNVSTITRDNDVNGYRHNFYDIAAKADYFMKNSENDTYLIKSPPFEFATIDYSNADAVQWFQTQIIEQNMLNESGATGFMTDFGEYIPFDSYLSDDTPISASFHNYYPLIYSQTVRDAVSEDVIAFHRISNLVSAKYTRVYWLGDQLVTWDSYDGIRSVLYALFSGGISGHSLSHSDIGGYTMMHNALFNYERSCELLMRWMELSAFSDTLYRSHPGNVPGKSCQVYTNNETIAHWYKFTSVFKALGGYRKELMSTDAYNKGYPLVRHLYLQYYDDTTVQKVVAMKLNFNDPDYNNRNGSYAVINEEFMLGDCILVAPILYPQVTARMVYLPKGKWINYWNHTETITSKGEFYWRDGPMGEPPVFVCPQWKYSLAL